MRFEGGLWLPSERSWDWLTIPWPLSPSPEMKITPFGAPRHTQKPFSTATKFPCAPETGFDVTGYERAML
jgi:hypothetical protein